MPIHAISSVWYPIVNWELAKNFYSKGLGLSLTECDDEAGWAALEIGSEEPPLFLVRKPEGETGGPGSVVTFEADEIEALLERIVEFGGEVDEEIQDADTVRIYTIYDPDGNAIELSEVLED